MSLSRTHALLLSSTLLVVGVLGFAPSSHALSLNASLGGGNALARATSGQSHGLTNANSASDLFGHLTLASTRGGRAEEVPPEHSEQSNSGGNSAGGQTGTDGDAGAQDVGSPSPSSGGANNGGAQAGNGGNGADGGNGGSASTGGLVRAGDVVSNANAVNMINVTIVRIGSR